MAKSVSIFWLLLLVAPLASAQIFKCVAKNGMDLYQNFPCGIDSIGSTATNAASDKAGLAQSDSKRAKPNASLPVGVAAGKSIIAQGEPRIGMTMEEVKAVWGEPVDSYQDELVEGRVEVWSYGRSRSVQFDLKGRVTAMQR
jgi:hypothetical protein